MIDVHPPQHGSITRRDFIVHLFIVVLGILIAIGLEQSVEALHRMHERHVLEHDLRQECEIARSNAEHNLRYYDARMLWLFGLKKDLDTMIAANGKVDLPYRPFQATPGMPTAIAFSDTAWLGARSEGKLTLLSDVEERTYGALYLQVERLAAGSLAMGDATKRLQSLDDQFSDVHHFDVPVFSRMSIEELVEYRAAVMNSLEETRQVKLWNAYALGVTDVLLHLDPHADAETLRQMVLKAELKERDAHPNDFDAMARQIEAQDAARDKAARKDSAEDVKRPQPKHAASS